MALIRVGDKVHLFGLHHGGSRPVRRTGCRIQYSQINQGCGIYRDESGWITEVPAGVVESEDTDVGVGKGADVCFVDAHRVNRR